MRAAVLTALTGPDAIELRDLPEPSPGPGQVLVDVHAAGVIFPDVLRTRGLYQVRPELPFILGWEVAGVVRADAAGFTAGQPVVALPEVGGFAETVAVDPAMVFPLPDGVPLDVAAAIPLNALTMHFALHRRARLQPGETVLVHGAGGGVGSAACQLAAAHGARVIAVVSTPQKGDVAQAAGAHEVLPVDDFLARARELTGGRGVDVVVDPVGGDRFTDSLRALAPEGRVVVLGFTAGQIPTVKVNRLLLGNTAVLGSAIREFWLQDPGHAATQWAELLPLIRSGALAPPIGTRLPLAQAAQAVRLLDERRVAGRVVLTLS